MRLSEKSPRKEPLVRGDDRPFVAESVAPISDNPLIVNFIKIEIAAEKLKIPTDTLLARAVEFNGINDGNTMWLSKRKLSEAFGVDLSSSRSSTIALVPALEANPGSHAASERQKPAVPKVDIVNERLEGGVETSIPRGRVLSAPQASRSTRPALVVHSDGVSSARADEPSRPRPTPAMLEKAVRARKSIAEKEIVFSAVEIAGVLGEPLAEVNRALHAYTRAPDMGGNAQGLSCAKALDFVRRYFPAQAATFMSDLYSSEKLTGKSAVDGVFMSVLASTASGRDMDDITREQTSVVLKLRSEVARETFEVKRALLEFEVTQMDRKDRSPDAIAKRNSIATFGRVLDLALNSRD